MFTSSPVTMVDTPDAQIAHRVVGAGPDVLFVHGWPLHGATWRHVVELMAPYARCHVIDLPGAGASGFDRSSPIDLMAHVEALRTTLDVLDLDEVVLVGQDSGGMLARFLAADDERVQALVLANTELARHVPPLVRVFVALSGVPGFEAAFRLLLRAKPIRRSDLVLGGCFADKTLLDGDFHELFLRPLIDDAELRWAAAELLRNYDLSLVDALAEASERIAVPMTCVWGIDDPFFPVALARKMADGSPRTTLHELADARLLVHEERPDEFARIALDVAVPGWRDLGVAAATS